MQVLSVVLKTVAAGSALLGVIAFIFDLRGRSLANIPQKHLLPLGIVLVACSLGLGLVDYVTSRSGGGEDSSGVTVHGNVYGGTIISAQTVSGLVIHQGDSPEERARKQHNARELLAAEIARNITALDARIGMARAALAPDDFAARYRSRASAVAPAVAQIAADGYARLLSRNTAASLRQAFASKPLRTDTSPLALQLAATAAVPADPFAQFYEQLTEAVYRTDVLLETLDSAGHRPDELSARRVDLARRGLEIQSRHAHLYGVLALDAMPDVATAHTHTLASVEHLSPRHLAPPAVIYGEIARVGRELGQLMTEKAALTSDMAAARDLDAEHGLAAIERSLTIDDGDTQATVAMKAISLRQLGRTEDAAVAFERYGRMFSAADPGATAYARTAQAFTRQLAALRVHGGVYLFQVDSGAAAEAGIRTGDIITAYAGETVTNPVELTGAMEKHSGRSRVPVTLLRYYRAGGTFHRLTLTVRTGRLGAGFMPI